MGSSSVHRRSLKGVVKLTIDGLQLGHCEKFRKTVKINSPKSNVEYKNGEKLVEKTSVERSLEAEVHFPPVKHMIDPGLRTK